MRTRGEVVVFAAALGVTAALLAPVGTSGAEAGGNVDRSVGPLIAGKAGYVDGTFAWTDYAYDDEVGFNPTYPASIAGGNAADLIQLQLALTLQGDLRIRAILETLTDPTLPLLGVGFDTDGDATTGAATIPGGQWTTQAPLGLDAFVVVSSDGGRLLRWSGAWNQASAFAADVDVASNSLSAVVPHADLDPAGAAWRTVGVLGLAQPGSSWLDGSGPVYDLAFVVAEPPGFFVGLTWQEVHQRNVLNGAQSEAFGVHTVDFARIALGDTELPALGTGFNTLLYHSDLRLGEGVRPMATQGFESVRSSDRVFAGPYQPYVARVPPVPGPLPAIVWLHGREGNHTQGAQLSFAAFDPPAVQLFVLGRGPNVGFGGTDIFGFVSDISVLGERDVLDVLADASERLPIDRERVLVSGYSMGAVGAFHMAELHPDAFTGILSLAGGDFGIVPFNHLRPRLLGNLLNVPLVMANGALDPLANAPGIEELYLTLDAIGYIDYRAYMAMRRAHVVFDPLVDCVYLELTGRPRAVDPPRVRYTMNPAFEIDDAATGLQMRHDAAYWVSGLALRDAGARNLTFEGQELDQSANASIDVTTLARPDRAWQHTPVNDAGENVTAGRDFCGPNPDVQTDESWRIHGMARSAAGAEPPVSNGLSAELTNLSAATLDLTRMGVSIAAPITATLVGDGETTLTLVGPWPAGVEITVTKRPLDLVAGAVGPAEQTWTIQAGDGELQLSDDLSGEHAYVLPEPGTMLPLALGFALMRGLRRRRMPR